MKRGFKVALVVTGILGAVFAGIYGLLFVSWHVGNAFLIAIWQGRDIQDFDRGMKILILMITWLIVLGSGFLMALNEDKDEMDWALFFMALFAFVGTVIFLVLNAQGYAFLPR